MHPSSAFPSKKFAATPPFFPLEFRPLDLSRICTGTAALHYSCSRVERAAIYSTMLHGPVNERTGLLSKGLPNHPTTDDDLAALPV